MATFCTSNIVIVFFFYGLAFFTMGLAVLIEVNHATEQDFGKTLRPLAFFGLIHGIHEWFEMGMIYYNQLTQATEPEWIFYLRILLLGSSFLFLVNFGTRLVISKHTGRRYWLLQGIIVGLWIVGLLVVLSGQPITRTQLIAADVYTRYALAIPGAVLAAWGLLLQRLRFRQIGLFRFGRDVTIAAAAFALYGAVGQLFVSPSSIFPSHLLNSTQFLTWFGFPIQVFRALMALIVAVAIIRSLRALSEEQDRKLSALHEEQEAHEKRLQKLRSELLYRTVRAQELERQRIARELHDETGQVLTALGMGLRGLSELISIDPNRAFEQARQLEALTSSGIAGLQRMVGGLRPPQLDELGLVPALRWYTQEASQVFALKIQIHGTINETTLLPEIKLTLFRIAQEAITNVARHAHANQVDISLEEEGDEIYLSIDDDGKGFDVEKALDDEELNCLGLLGMIERAHLAGGNCQISSSFGKGTRVEVWISKDNE